MVEKLLPPQSDTMSANSLLEKFVPCSSRSINLPFEGVNFINLDPSSFNLNSIFFVFTYSVIQKTTLPPIILSTFLGITLSIISAFLISFFNKISIHMVGISGILAALIALFLKFSASYFYEITIVVLIWGLVGFSRLKLKKHNHQEIYFGAFLGIICVFIPTYFGITI